MPLADRFIKYGQNTPLTCVFVTGGEDNDTASDGIASTTGASYATASPDPHQSAGNGGTRYRNITSSGGNDVFLANPQLREFVLVAAVYTSTGSEQEWRTREAAGPTTQIAIAALATTGVLRAMRNATTIGSSLGGSVPNDQWNWHHTWGFIDNSAGFVRHRIGSFANLVLDISSVDTQAHASTDYFDQTMMVHPSGAGGTCRYDEFAVYARSLYWSGGSGTVPSVGATITGGTSGATAIVTNVYHDGAGTGVFFVRTVTGAFTATETISSGGWSANSDNTLSNTEADLWIPELYGVNYTPSADASAGFTNTTGANHFSVVADSSTATFVSTSTVGQTDVYDTTGTLPPGATIYAVASKMYARLNGVSASDAIIVGLDDGAGPIDLADESGLSGSYESHMAIATNNPNTGVQFTTTEIGNMQLRVTSN